MVLENTAPRPRSDSSDSSAIDLSSELEGLNVATLDDFHLLEQDGKMTPVPRTARDSHTCDTEDINVRPLVHQLDRHQTPQSLQRVKALKSLVRRLKRRVPGARARRRLLKPFRMRVKKFIHRFVGRFRQLHYRKASLESYLYQGLQEMRAMLLEAHEFKDLFLEVLRQGLHYLRNTPSRFQVLLGEMRLSILRETLLSLVKKDGNEQQSLKTRFLDPFPLSQDTPPLKVCLAHIGLCSFALLSGYVAASALSSFDDQLTSLPDYPGHWEQAAKPHYRGCCRQVRICSPTAPALATCPAVWNFTSLMKQLNTPVLDYVKPALLGLKLEPASPMNQTLDWETPRHPIKMSSQQQNEFVWPESRPNDVFMRDLLRKNMAHPNIFSMSYTNWKKCEALFPHHSHLLALASPYVSSPFEDPLTTCPNLLWREAESLGARNITAARDAKRALHGPKNISRAERRKQSLEQEKCPVSNEYEPPLSLHSQMPILDVPIKNITAARENYHYLMDGRA